MRIIIECNEKEGTVTGQTPPEAMSGGAPSESLIQAMAGTSQVPAGGATPGGGMNAGPPPEWLMKAIREATAPGTEGAGGASDGGAAPPGQ